MRLMLILSMLYQGGYTYMQGGSPTKEVPELGETRPCRYVDLDLTTQEYV